MLAGMPWNDTMILQEVVKVCAESGTWTFLTWRGRKKKGLRCIPQPHSTDIKGKLGAQHGPVRKYLIAREFAAR